MASIHRKKLGSGRVVWELTHGRGKDRIRLVAGETKEAAEGLLAQFKRQLVQHDAAPAAVSLERAIAAFSAHLSLNRSGSTARRYGRVIKTFGIFVERFCPEVKLLRDVKAAHVEAYKRRRVAGEIGEAESHEDLQREQQLRIELARQPKSASPKANAKYGWLGRKRLHEHVAEQTINYEVDVIHTFFRFAIKQNLCFANPAAAVERFRVPKQALPKFLSREELTKFFAACKEQEQRLFATLLLTGMRRGELEFLTWEDVNFDLGIIFVRAKEGWKPKTDERVIPISPTLQSILLEQFAGRRSEQWAFANRSGSRFAGRHLLDRMHRICRKAGIRRTTLHALRHSFGAHLRMAGVSLADIGDLLGHKNLATTQIYAKVHQEHLRSVVGRLSPLLPGGVANDASPKCVTRTEPGATQESKRLNSGTNLEIRGGQATEEVEQPGFPASQQTLSIFESTSYDEQPFSQPSTSGAPRDDDT